MEENEIILKPIYLSKKDMLKKIPYINTEKDDNSYHIKKIMNNYSNPKKYKNLERKNLTYQNFLDFTYDFNNITEHKLKMPDHLKIKQKYELISDKGYSPFRPKKPHKNIVPLLITGLNTPNNKKNSNIFSSSQQSFENSDIKTKESSNKFNRSNFFNYNSSNKNALLFPSEISKSIIHFNSNIDKYTKNDNKDEGLKAFVLKSKLILKEKIIRQELTDKLNNHNDFYTDRINILNKKKEQLLKNLKYFDIFDKVYVNYIKEIIQEEAKERRYYLLLNKRKNELENEVIKLHKKIDKIKIDLANYESLKRFFKFSKDGLDSLLKKEFKENENNKEIENIKKNKENEKIKENKENEKKNNEKKNITPQNKRFDFKKKLSISTNSNLLSFKQKMPTEKRDSSKKSKYFSRFKSLKPMPRKSELIEIDENENHQKKIKKKEILNGRKSRRKSSMIVNQKQYEHIFTNVENSILKNIEISDKQRNLIYEEKKNLEETENYFIKRYEYIKETIEEKEIILARLKEENYNLKMKYNSFSKINLEGSLSQNILEKKMLEVIFNVNRFLNVQEILNIKNLLSMLKLNSIDFLQKYKKTKFIYLIKIIELIISYLISKKNKYMSEPKLKEEFKNFLFKLENDKKIRMNKLNKEMLQKERDNKKEKALDKAKKIRFFPYRKFDLTPYKYRKNKTKIEKINNKTAADEQYEQWLMYD